MIPESLRHLRRAFWNPKSEFLVWPNSDSSIGKIMMETLEVKRMKIFGTSFIKEMNPYIIRTLYTTTGQYFTLCYMNNCLNFSYFEERTLENDLYPIQDCLPECIYYFLLR